MMLHARGYAARCYTVSDDDTSRARARRAMPPERRHATMIKMVITRASARHAELRRVYLYDVTRHAVTPMSDERIRDSDDDADA